MNREFQVDDTDADVRAAFAELSGEAPASPPAGTGGDEGTPPPADDKGDVHADAGTKVTVDDKGRPRVNGKFAPRTAVKGEEEKPDDKGKPPAAAKPGEEQKPADGQPPAAAAPKGPPPSFSVKTKAEWDKLPEHVRADIIKREQETSEGLAALRDFKDLKPWADMAQKHGTTIGKSLERYVGMENALKQDAGTGLAIILQNLGYSKEKAADLFASLAAKYGHAGPAAPAGGAKPGQPAPGAEPDPLLDLLRPVMQPLIDKVSGIESRFTAQDQNAVRSQAQQQIDTLATELGKFASDPANKFYAELEETMTSLIAKGLVPLTGNHQADLRKAYDTAAGMHPEVREAQIEMRLQQDREARRVAEQEAAQNARRASRSLTGSRVPATVVTKDAGQQPPPSHGDDVEDDVRAAFRAVRRA